MYLILFSPDLISLIVFLWYLLVQNKSCTNNSLVKVSFIPFYLGIIFYKKMVTIIASIGIASSLAI